MSGNVLFSLRIPKYIALISALRMERNYTVILGNQIKEQIGGSVKFNKIDSKTVSRVICREKHSFLGFPLNKFVKKREMHKTSEQNL